MRAKAELRPAPETRARRPKIPEIPGQRLAPACLTNGNADDFHRPGKISQESGQKLAQMTPVDADEMHAAWAGFIKTLP
jgi:hypothetical protein